MVYFLPQVRHHHSFTHNPKLDVDYMPDPTMEKPNSYLAKLYGASNIFNQLFNVTSRR